jgi:hypothetical protein
MQAKQQQQQQQQPAQPQVLHHAASVEQVWGSQGTVSTLGLLLADLQRQHLQATTPAAAAAAAPGQAHAAPAVARLDRKLTSMLADCTSWQDVAAVLAAADSTGRLNSVHVAAAAATVARLACAERAAAAAAAGSAAAGAELALSGVVPQSKQQWRRMRVVRTAVAAAVAAGWHSRWHLPGSLAAPACAAVSVAAAEQHEGVAVSFGEALGGDDDASSGSSCSMDGHQHLLEQLCAAVADAWPSMSAASMTSALWSLAVLGGSLPGALLPAVGEVLLDMAQALQLAGQAGQHSSSSSEAQGRPAYNTGELPRQLVVLLWSLARMGVEPGELAPHTTCQQQQRQQQQQETASSSSAVHAVLHVLLPWLPSLSFQGLSMLLWALGTWQLPLQTPAQLLEEGIEEDTAAAAAAEPALLAATAAALQAGAAAGCAQGLAVQLWALARLGLCPPPAWLAAWLAAMWAALPASSSHDCAMSAWALAKLGIAPPGDWLAALCSRAEQLAARLGPQELPPLLWALARLRYRPQLRVAQALLMRGQALAAGGRLSPQGLALLLWAPACLGLAPRGGWVEAVLAPACGYLPLFRACEASALLVGLARLQHIPGPLWLQEWWQHTAAMLPYAHGRQLVLLLWGAVRLGQAPPAGWLRVWQAASGRAMAAGQVSSQGYGIMWAALQQLELAPAPAWLALYWRASSQPHALDGLDCLAAQRSLAGLAAVSGRLPEGLTPPRQWVGAFLAASQQLLPGASSDTIAGMLLAAGELQLALPRPWLAAAMARLAELLTAQGVISPSSSAASSSGGGSGQDSARTTTSSRNSAGVTRAHCSLSLAARLQRRQLAVQLQRVLAGLRAQQMLAAPAGRHGRQSGGAPATAAAAAGGLGVADALATWPWVADAVRATWPDKRAAEQALRALSGRS